METAAEVLLVIVSAFLAVFLIVLSITLIFVIRLLKKANEVVGTVESAADAIKISATSIPFIRIIKKILKIRRKAGKK